MSIIAKNKGNKRKMLNEYHENCAKQNIAERNAMNEMLDVLRNADHPMTAAQIEAACTSGISKHEIAGNLYAMKNRNSRYRGGYPNRSVSIWSYGVKVPAVTIPTNTTRKDYGDGERIVTKGGGRRKATVIELDENGIVIPNSKQVVTICESKRYAIEKMK